MNNFKDYLNLSPNLADNLYKMSLIALNEAKKKKAKKTKKANKDYDGDGEVESGSDEYLGSRSNAIKKAIAKREAKELKEYTRRQDPDYTGQPEKDEEFDEESIKEMQRRIRDDEVMALRKKAASMGGITDDMVNPLPGDITFMTPEQIDAANRAQTGVFGRPTTTQTGVFGRPTTNRMEKKKSLKEGREVIGGGFIYGGFPRKLNEAKGGLPNEMIVDLIRSNSHEGYDPEDAEQYPLLPADVHSAVADLIEDELEIGQSAEIPRGLNYPKHIDDLTTALGILNDSGHGNHPAALHIGDLAARFQDAQDIRQY